MEHLLYNLGMVLAQSETERLRPLFNVLLGIYPLKDTSFKAGSGDLVKASDTPWVLRCALTAFMTYSTSALRVSSYQLLPPSAWAGK